MKKSLLTIGLFFICVACGAFPDFGDSSVSGSGSITSSVVIPTPGSLTNSSLQTGALIEPYKLSPG